MAEPCAHSSRSPGGKYAVRPIVPIGPTRFTTLAGRYLQDCEHTRESAHRSPREVEDKNVPLQHFHLHVSVGKEPGQQFQRLEVRTAHPSLPGLPLALVCRSGQF